MLVSVIVPVYNVEKYLSNCLDSIINQSYSDIEIILIDDGSTDNSGHICDMYSLKDKRVRVIHQKNKGVSNARNVGLKISKGQYISFVDSDDVICSWHIECLLNVLIKEHSDFIRGSIVDSIDDAVTRPAVYTNIEFIEHEILSKKFLGVVWMSLFDSSIIKLNSLKFDENIYNLEDMLFLAQYLAFCKKVVLYRSNSYQYIYRNDSSSNKRYSNKMLTGLEAMEKMQFIFEDNGLYELKSRLQFFKQRVRFWLLIRMQESNVQNEDFYYVLKQFRKNIQYSFFIDSISFKEFVNMVLLYISPAIRIHCGMIYKKYTRTRGE